MAAFSLVALAQEPCATVQYHKRKLINNPGLAAADAAFEQRMAAMARARQQNPSVLDVATTYTIPVVFHIVYKEEFDSLNADIIKVQLARLNEDFNNEHSDFNKIPAAFTGVTGNMNIRFALAQTDPNGNPTTGYRYHRTNRVFDESVPGNDEFMKRSSTDGIDGWPPTQYLNVWVCALGGINGFATWPTDLGANPNYDGVVISTGAFGIHYGNKIQTNYGRTLPHEVGHWLGLIHVWADDQDEANKCLADDEVGDTPKQSVPNYGLFRPNYIHVSCSNGPAGDMWMNFMDYADHLSRYMFTLGQVARARTTLTTTRLSLTTSNKHLPPVHNSTTVPIFTTNAFTALAVGKNNTIWAGTNRSGLYKFDGTSWAISNGALDGYRINGMTSDKNGGIWIAQQGTLAGGAYAAGGGVHYYPDGSVFTGRRYFNDATNNGLPTRSGRSVFVDTAFNSAEPRVWVSTMNQLDPFDDSPVPGGIGLGLAAASPFFSKITAGLDASIVNGGTYTVGGNSSQVFIYSQGSTGGAKVLVYNATTAALVSTFDNNNTGGALPANFFIRAIYGDARGNKWFGLDNGGVAFANTTNAWQRINYASIFPSGSSVNNNAIAGDRDGNVFIGTSAGLVMYNGAGNGVADITSFRLFTTADGLPSNNVTALAVDTVRRKIIIGTDNGITYWDKDCLMKPCHPKVPAIASTTKNGNWSDPTVWSNGTIPDCNTIVVVYHTLAVDPNNATCHTFFLVSGANATINSKITMTGGCSQ